MAGQDGMLNGGEHEGDGSGTDDPEGDATGIDREAIEEIETELQEEDKDGKVRAFENGEAEEADVGGWRGGGAVAGAGQSKERLRSFGGGGVFTTGSRDARMAKEARVSARWARARAASRSASSSAMRDSSAFPSFRNFTSSS